MGNAKYEWQQPKEKKREEKEKGINKKKKMDENFKWTIG